MTKSPWTLPEPWTHRTRPPLLGKPQNGFPQAPTGFTPLSVEERRTTGDISISPRTGTFLFRLDTSYAQLLTSGGNRSTMPLPLRHRNARGVSSPV